MDPRHLVQLATILEKGSITQASHYLNLTQPTLTHNMQTLEMQAGGMLFERSRLGVRSTPMGELLAREGRAIARRLKDAAIVSARHRSGQNTQVRLGVGPIVGAALLPGLMQLMLNQPQMGLTIQSDRPHLLLDQLVDGHHDLVIAPSWLERPPQGIERFLLVKDDLGIFCGASHPLAAKAPVRPEDTDGLSWISLGTASPFDQDVRDMLTSGGVGETRTEIVVLGEAFMLLRILAQGRHLCVLPRFPLQLLSPYFALAELKLPTRQQPRNIYLWCKSTSLEDPVFATMKDNILAYAAGLQNTEKNG